MHIILSLTPFIVFFGVMRAASPIPLWVDIAATTAAFGAALLFTARYPAAVLRRQTSATS